MFKKMNTTRCDLTSWVEAAPSGQKDFREAVQLILTAITSDIDLRKTMVMKGGVLMAIRYNSSRYTTDLDFSSYLKRGEIDLKEFEHRFTQSLAGAVADSEYDLDCRIQSCKLNPKREDSNFSNIEVSIGYANKGTSKHRRLMLGQSPTIIAIDFNLNEMIFGIDSLELGAGASLQAYTLEDLVAEKLRSLLQQPVRNRFRRQDTYDLRMLIEKGIEEEKKGRILESLLAKARSRGLEPTLDSLADPEVRRRAARDYPTLADELEVELPDFAESFNLVDKFYRSLPWDEI